MSPFVREHPYAVYDMLMYFWNSSPTDCLAVSITYNSSKQWSTGERIVYFTVCFISWVPEIFSRVRRGASSADTPSAIGRRHERRRVPRAPRISGSQSICFTPTRGSKKNSNYIVHWVRSSHVLFAQGHFLPLLVNDFVRR